MYIRKQKRKNGRIYLSVVSAYRTSDGKNRSKHVRSLGYLDELEKIYDDPIAHFEAELAEENKALQLASTPYVIELSKLKKIDKKTCSTIELGEAVVSAYFNRDLDLDGFFEKKRTARKVAFNPGRVLELLIWDRIAHPSSKKRAWQACESFPRKCDFSLDDTYRALTYLAEKSDELIAHINTSLDISRGPRNKTRLYYDVTNYYFEVENEDVLRRRGVSKENRPNPIVQMGLLLDGDGLPYNFDIFPGNQNDMTTMLPIMKKAQLKNSSERIIMVADKGLNTSDNIVATTLDGNGFIFSQSVRRATKELKTWVCSDTDYEINKDATFKIKSRISEKPVYILDSKGHKKQVKLQVKEVAFWSKDFFERTRYERERTIEKSIAAIERGDASGFVARSCVRYTKDIPVVKQTGEIASHNWVINEEKIKEDEKLDGYYCIITSELDMNDREIIEAYRGLWRIEESFRVLKTDFDARPVYVSREDHIRAHFLICYIALLIMRLIQKDTKWVYTASQISKALKNIVGHGLDTNLYLFDYRTDLTDELGKIIGIDLSRQVLTKGEIRSIMAEVKS